MNKYMKWLQLKNDLIDKIIWGIFAILLIALIFSFEINNFSIFKFGDYKRSGTKLAKYLASS